MIAHSNFFKRLVSWYFILLTIIISVAAAVIYSITIDRIKSDAEIAAVKLAENKAKQVDSYLKELDTLAEQVRHQQDITGIFYNLENRYNTGNYFDKDILNEIEVSSQLKQLLAERTASYNISIFNKNGDFVSSQNYMMKDSRAIQTTSVITYSYDEARLRVADGMVVLPPQANPWTKSERQFITLVKALKNDYTDTICGIIEVRGDVKYLEKILCDDIDGRVLIRERSDGTVLLPHNFSEENSEKEYVSAPLGSLNWEVAIEKPDVFTTSYSIFLILMFILCYIALLAFCFVLISIMGRHVTKPLTELSKHVRNIDNSSAKLDTVDAAAIDEVKLLEDSFNKMLERVNHSMMQEKKAYSLALQAQMNPHFLYNMLSVISAAACEAECDNIVNMCVELSDMLRYVTAYEAVSVPLRDEITHTKNYLSLMKSRYEDYFSYTISIDDELLNMSVPKLCIQPLAENCFKHGFKNAEPPWNVNIEMHGKLKNWELIVKDNGTGIAEECISELKSKIDSAADEMSLGEIGGIGIVNTIVRLKILHNKEVKYQIYNDNGAVIRITVGR